MGNAEKVCEIDECGARVYARGWCNKHYLRWRHHGDPTADHSRVRKPCSIEDCDATASSRGWCPKHYTRWLKHGDPLQEPPAPAGECAVKECVRASAARGWCKMHWKRWKTHGDPNYQRPTTCSVAECESAVAASGLCKKHYNRKSRHGDTDRVLISFGLSPLERLWVDVTPGDPQDCWPWQGARQENGYGTLTYGGTGHRAHRFAYETLVGPIPEGHVLDHQCHDPKTCGGGVQCPHRQCCNPIHMQPAAKAYNNSGERAVSANGRKTHCKRGHAFTPANTKITTSGGRACRRCIAVREDERSKRRRAQAR